MNVKKIILGLLLALIPASGWAKINVVTTTEDTAALAREIGGDLVTVEPLCRGYMDPHFVEAKPSYLLKLKKADLFIQIGLELESGWAPSLLMSARNRKILPGSNGFLDASNGCEILQKMDRRPDRSQGDVHPLGNPHYWLDPSNGRIIAANIADTLAKLDPANEAAYRANFASFEGRLKEKMKAWHAQLAPFKGARVVTYHNSWPNFAKHFEINVVNYVEPRAGIPPSPGHIRELENQIRTQKIPVLLIEPYFDAKLPRKIAQETGCRMVLFAPSVGAEPSIKTYFDLFDHDVKLLSDALNSANN